MSAPGLVVVGASLAGQRAVEAARRSGFDGTITLIGAEPHLPYDRPPLSKEFLTKQATPKFFRTEASSVAGCLALGGVVSILLSLPPVSQR